MPGTDTVTVACKMPHGLRLRIFQQYTVQDPQQGGGTKSVKKWEPVPDSPQILIKGYLENYDPDLPPAAKGSSFALTHNVPTEFFETWMKQNATSDLVLNHLIFAAERQDDVQGMMKDHAKQRSGLEPINPKDLKGRIQSALPAKTESLETAE